MSNLNASSNWTAAAACFGVWAVFCLPFWLLGMGFAGRFFLPTVATDATDALLLSLLFCVFFYGLLLVAFGLAWSSVREDQRASDRAGTAENPNAENESLDSVMVEHPLHRSVG